jgi:hypothetical protein
MLERWPLFLTRASVRHPRRTIAVFLAAIALVAPGLLRLELRTDGHALVPPDDPVVKIDAEVREHFGLRDPIVVLVETSHPAGIFNRETLIRVQKLSDALAKLDGVGPRQVVSLATEHRDRVYPGTLNFRPFLDPMPDSPSTARCAISRRRRRPPRGEKTGSTWSAPRWPRRCSASTSWRTWPSCSP